MFSKQASGGYTWRVPVSMISQANHLFLSARSYHKPLWELPQSYQLEQVVQGYPAWKKHMNIHTATRTKCLISTKDRPGASGFSLYGWKIVGGTGIPEISGKPVRCTHVVTGYCPIGPIGLGHKPQKTINPFAGLMIALRSANVIRGASIPMVVDFTSSIAELSGALPSLFTAT
jgi:hypothetical protein